MQSGSVDALWPALTIQLLRVFLERAERRLRFCSIPFPPSRAVRKADEVVVYAKGYASSTAPSPRRRRTGTSEPCPCISIRCQVPSLLEAFWRSQAKL